MATSLLSACSSDGTATTTAPQIDPTTTSTASESTTSTAEAATTTSSQQTTTTVADETLRFDFVVTDGVVDGPQRAKIELGSIVELTVESDVADELHLHGYDLTVDLEPGVPGTLRLTADIPGIFEMELESSHLLISELEVAP